MNISRYFKRLHKSSLKNADREIISMYKVTSQFYCVTAITAERRDS